MSDLDIEVGKYRPYETTFYNKVKDAIEELSAVMTPAEVNGILLQIQLETLGVFDDE